jgi:hypothetical protein
LCDTTAPRLVVCGKSPATCPERFVNASIAGFFPAELMDEYYELRGWDVKTGLLKKKTLERLDLTDVIKPLGERVL